jgi:hypothetical protein
MPQFTLLPPTTMTAIEMDDLSKRVNKDTDTSDSVPTDDGVEPIPDAVSTFWAWTTASLSVSAHSTEAIPDMNADIYGD